MKITYLLVLQNLRESLGGIFDGMMLEITSLGEPLYTFLLLAFVYWCMDKRAGIYMAGNVGLSCTFSQYFKWLFRIERPWIRDPRIVPVDAALSSAGGYSFPSGHTVRAAATWGALAAYSRKSNKALCCIGWLVVFLVAFSRNYLGVHTSWDILGAVVLTVSSMWLMAKALAWSEGGKNRDIVVGMIGCVVCFLPMLWAGCLSNAGAAFGMWLGWIVERRFIKFKSCRNSVEKLVRFGVGGLGILLIQTAFPAALKLWMAPKYADFFTMFVLMLFILAVYPFFFSRKKRWKEGGFVILLAFVLIGSLTVIKVRGNADRTVAGESVNTEAGQTAGELPPGNVGDEVTAELPTENVGDEAAAELSTENTSDAGNTGGEVETAPQPLVIAHRGYSSLFPENTLAAFSGAADIGADMIELDVQLSRDGTVVVYHDNDLARIGMSGNVIDYNLEELRNMDVGEAFVAEYSGERMPTLEEVLELVENTELDIYLELKDIGDVSGYEDAVLACVENCQMTGRCVFASFNSQYLERLKELNETIEILYIANSYDAALARQLRPKYWGLHKGAVSQEVVEEIHGMGSYVYVWTVDEPEEMVRIRDLGADGIVTNRPGTARVIREPQYAFLAERYVDSFALPGLYGNALPEACMDAVVQGMTYADGYILISAYRKSGSNSLLYVLDSAGKWLTTVDMGFAAHTGGIAYDPEHDYLWVTGASGSVCALSWTQMKECFAEGEKGDIVFGPAVLFSFDAGLVNHNGDKVASFLDVVNGRLYVGSYVIGSEGMLRGYDITAPAEPVLLTEQKLPEKIQGMTVIAGDEGDYLLLSQSASTEDSLLLVYCYDEQAQRYDEAIQSYVLPEGAEQMEALGDRIMILFESAARPYQETARIRNDQVWIVEMKKGF